MASVPNDTVPGIERGDVFGRYTIWARLGRGNSSSVWLAERTVMRQGREASHSVALKVLIAPNSSIAAGSDFEQQLARREIEALRIPDDCLLIPDDVIYEGLSGRLGLLFTQLCGPSVSEYSISCPDRRLPWSMAKRTITDAIAALQFLHAHGVGHGDLQTRNLLLVPDAVESFRDADVMLLYAQSRERIVDTHPEELTQPVIKPMMSFFKAHNIIFTGAIKLADFGSGFISAKGGTGKSRWDVKAPERLENKAWGLPADIWSLGCTILELVMGKHFIQGPAPIPRREWTDEIFLELVEKRLANMEYDVRAFLCESKMSDMTNAEQTVIEEMVIGMLRRRPEARLEMDEVYASWQAIQF